MTKKDFELIARVLREQSEEWPIDHPVQSEYAGMRLAFFDALRESNPRFDAQRFLAQHFLDAARPRPTAYLERIERIRNMGKDRT